MLPAIAEVIQVVDYVAGTDEQRPQLRSRFIRRLVIVIQQKGGHESLAAPAATRRCDRKLMEMAVGPLEGRLDHGVHLVQGEVGIDFEPAPDRRHCAPEIDTDDETS